MTTFNDVLSAARSLNAADQVRLANTLMADVAPENWPLPDEAWIAEAAQRSADFDAGRVTAASWPEVQARARRAAGLDG